MPIFDEDIVSSLSIIDLLQASPSIGGGIGLSLSVRDLLSWAGFITSSMSSGNVASAPQATSTSPCHTDAASGLGLWEAYVHGAALVLLDGLGLGAGLSPLSMDRLRKACAKVLKDQVRAPDFSHTGFLSTLGCFWHHRPTRQTTQLSSSFQFRNHACSYAA